MIFSETLRVFTSLALKELKGNKTISSQENY